MRTFNKSEFARICGVDLRSIQSGISTGKLSPAVTKNNRINVDHPVAREYMSAHGVHEVPEKAPTAAAARARQAEKLSDGDGGRDISEDGPAQAWDIKKLEHLSIKEVVMRYGSVQGFKGYVDALRSIADYQHRDLRVQTQRAELIDREFVVGRIKPVIDLAFQRLVSDGPEGLAKQVIARAQSGGIDTLADVTAMIRDRNSQVLKDLKRRLQTGGNIDEL